MITIHDHTSWDHDIFPVKRGELILALSRAVDLPLSAASISIAEHGTRVAYICNEIAQSFGMSESRKYRLILAALVYDIGVSKTTKAKCLNTFKFEENVLDSHAERGAELLETVPELSHIAEIVRYHHHNASEISKIKNVSDDLIMDAMIIHAADRLDILIDRKSPALMQKEHCLKMLNEQSGKTFMSSVLEELDKIGKREAFWFSLEQYNLRSEITKIISKDSFILMENLLGIAKMFAKVIDDKCSFTHKHSQGVAHVASSISDDMGGDNADHYQMLLAGYFHDLGKLSVPDEILMKPGSLTNSELIIMKSHVYYTYHILDHIEGFEIIRDIAGFHHEKLNSDGYPFHKSAESLSIQARAMCVADILQALLQDRPYRPSMKDDQVKNILQKLVKDKLIDKEITSLVLDSFDKYKSLAVQHE